MAKLSGSRLTARKILGDLKKFSVRPVEPFTCRDPALFPTPC